jgi:hypothetical protein
MCPRWRRIYAPGERFTIYRTHFAFRIEVDPGEIKIGWLHRIYNGLSSATAP